MKNQKIRVSCVDANKVAQFFETLSNSITSGSSKIWVRSELNGEMSFMVGNESIRLSVSSLKKGGLL